LAAKCGTAEVIVNRKIAPTIKREVSVAIDHEALPSTKLGGIPIAINVEVSCSINRNVSIAIRR
jgi:hypothetical protein